MLQKEQPATVPGTATPCLLGGLCPPPLLSFALPHCSQGGTGSRWQTHGGHRQLQKGAVWPLRGSPPQAESQSCGGVLCNVGGGRVGCGTSWTPSGRPKEVLVRPRAWLPAGQHQGLHRVGAAPVFREVTAEALSLWCCLASLPWQGTPGEPHPAPGLASAHCTSLWWQAPRGWQAHRKELILSQPASALASGCQRSALPVCVARLAGTLAMGLTTPWPAPFLGGFERACYLRRGSAAPLTQSAPRVPAMGPRCGNPLAGKWGSEV